MCRDPPTEKGVTVKKLYRFPKPCMVYRNTHIMAMLAAAIRDEDGETANKIMDHQFAAYVPAGAEATIFTRLQESGMLMVEVKGLHGKWIVHPSTIEPAEDRRDNGETTESLS